MAEWIVEAETLGDVANGIWVSAKRFVRCKDCKSSKGEELGLVYCYALKQWVRKDFYCGCSKPRDGGEK